MTRPKLPADVHLDALARARRTLAEPTDDPAERAIDFHDWLRASTLDKYGWRAALVDGRPALMIRDRLVRLDPAKTEYITRA